MTDHKHKYALDTVTGHDRVMYRYRCSVCNDIFFIPRIMLYGMLLPDEGVPVFGGNPQWK